MPVCETDVHERFFLIFETEFYLLNTKLSVFIPIVPKRVHIT